jgi:DNA-binding transcriptional ArsR family regulator
MTYEAVLAALADPTRRTILELLREGPSAVGDLAGHLPVSRAAVSQHLRVLREANLVSETAAGTKHIYRAEPEGLEQLKTYVEDFWSDVLGAYAGPANEPPKKTRTGRKR